MKTNLMLATAVLCLAPFTAFAAETAPSKVGGPAPSAVTTPAPAVTPAASPATATTVQPSTGQLPAVAPAKMDGAKTEGIKTEGVKTEGVKTDSTKSTEGDHAKRWQACQAEIAKFCGTVEKGKGNIKACLETNAKDVSEGCKTSMKEHADKAEAARKAAGQADASKVEAGKIDPSKQAPVKTVQ